MRLSRILLIFRKESRDILRDRRTLVATFVLPLVLYPGFIIGFAQVMAVERGRIAQETYTVGVRGQPNAPDLFDPAALRKHQLELAPDIAPHESALLAGRLQLVVAVPEDFRKQIEADTTARLVVLYDQSDVRSREALERFKSLVEDYRQSVLKRRLEGLDPPRSAAFVHPVRVVPKNRAPQAQVLLSLAGGVLVFLAVTMALTGAFYPAVDACAGEKERGTIETLLVSPATRSEIVWGKYLLVLVMSLATAVMNLFVMALTIFALVRLQAPAEGLAQPLATAQLAQALPSMIWVFVLLIPVAAFFSGLSLAVAAFARSTKEAQYYMLPLYLLALPLAAVGAVTGVELNYLLDLVPVAGAAVVFRNLLAGREGTGPHAILVFLANSVYAAVAIQWAASLFRREEVLFREAEEFEWRFWRWYSFRSRDGRPTLGHVVLALGGGLVLVWYATAFLVGLREPVSMAVLSQVVAVAAPPILLAALFRLRWRGTFRLRAPRWWSVALVIPLAGGVHVLAAELMYGLRDSLPRPRVMEDFVNQMFEGPLGPLGVLLAAALVPALAEELMFRGFVLSGLRSRMGPVKAVLASALLFGLFHLNLYQLVLGTILGLVLAVLALRTGSIVIPMLFHLTNNVLGVFIMLMHEPRWAGRLRPFFGRLGANVLAEGHQHYDASVVLVGAALAVGSAVLIWRVTRPEADLRRPETL